MADDDARRAELAESLREIRSRVDAACLAAGRQPGEVELLAVTKTFPARDAALENGVLKGQVVGAANGAIMDVPGFVRVLKSAQGVQQTAKLK